MIVTQITHACNRNWEIGERSEKRMEDFDSFFAWEGRGEGGLRKFLWGCWTIFLNWNKKPAPRAYYNTIDFCKGH